MDIEHMGEKVVEQVVEKGLISLLSDIYLLDEKKLRNLRLQRKVDSQSLASIDASRKCPLTRFIMGLGIKYVGIETAELLNDHFDLDQLLHIKEEDLLPIEGIGEKTAPAIVKYFRDPENVEEIKLLLRHGVEPKQEKKKQITGHPFSGKTFVLTGALQNYSRDEAARLIKERGGHVSGSVSKATDYVVVGEDPGSKYDKAQKLGVRCLSEKQFKEML